MATTARGARFRVPAGRTLLVVSSLARGAKTYPLRVSARQAAPESAQTPPSPSPWLAGGVVPKLTPPVLPPPPQPTDQPPPSARVFHLMVRDGDVASASNYLAVPGRLAAYGARVQVYVDTADREGIDPEVLREVVDTFDHKVFPVAARTIGLARDVDGDGRFTVFLSGWLSRLSGGKHSVDGFVRGADVDLGIPAPFSNHCDMMYLNAAAPAGPHLRTVMAHEYTHAVTFSRRAYPPAGAVASAADEEGWLDEGVAHLAEDLHGFSRSNIDYRVSAFLSQPERYRLVVDDYYSADLFRSHGNRGATYLFLRWCADRYGPGFLPALIGSDRRGVENLESVTGARFEDLYRAWSVGLYLSGVDPSFRQADDYRSLSVRGELDGWDLAGPRTTEVVPGGSAVSWESAATASRYLVVGPSRTGAAEVVVEAPAEAKIQVTAVPLPADLADVKLVVEPEVSGGSKLLRFRLKEAAGTPVRSSALAWEPLVPQPDPHAPGFRRAGLDSSRLASVFGSTWLPSHGLAESSPVQAAEALESGCPLVFKWSGTDVRGRRVAAWAELVPRSVFTTDRVGNGSLNSN